MRVLVIGAAGTLGADIMTQLAGEHDISGTTRAQLDITDWHATQEVIAAHTPQVVINAAAWTDVDGCARDEARAVRINGLGAQNVALAAAACDAAVVQISSNEVFDGTAAHPYREYDTPRPINPYGYSKFVGEQSVMHVNPRHYIVRLSWLFAPHNRNFIHAILDAARAGKALRVVVDEVAIPTYSPDVAAAIGQLIQSERYGIYHLCNAGEPISRYAFAEYALQRAGLLDEVSLTRISRHQWQRPSQPPAYTGLANEAAASLGITLRHWQAAVDAFLQAQDHPTPQPTD